ncbi:MAG: folate family ECF transporter S component [Clostridia bacterium]|nr:folate family ECF transporter S component [Clostridia bacterium]
MENISKTKKNILSALLLTLEIVFARFLSIKTPFLVISFSFVPIILASIWLGPKYTVLIAGIADIIGAICFPFGEFFIGFTISACLEALIYGLILHKKNGELTRKELIIRLIISSLIVLLFVHTLLNTIWLVIMYNKAFWVIFGTRMIKELIMFPIQLITIVAIVEGLKPILKKYM